MASPVVSVLGTSVPPYRQPLAMQPMITSPSPVDTVALTLPSETSRTAPPIGTATTGSGPASGSVKRTIAVLERAHGGCLAVPRRVEVVRAVGPQVQRLGIEDQDARAPRGRERLVDRRAEQVEVAGGERVLAARMPHPVGILDVAVCFEPDRAAGPPERHPLRDELEQGGDLDCRVEVVGRRDRPLGDPRLHVAGQALLARAVCLARAAASQRERVRVGTVSGHAAEPLAAEWSARPVAPAPQRDAPPMPLRAHRRAVGDDDPRPSRPAVARARRVHRPRACALAATSCMARTGWDLPTVLDAQDIASHFRPYSDPYTRPVLG